MRLLFAILMMIIFSSITFAQDEEITLTTYYPAPYGNYESIASDLLMLSPTISPVASPTSADEGLMYYDNSDRELKLCAYDSDTDSYIWTGSGGRNIWLRKALDVYYKKGKVGIGTDVPNRSLEISSSDGTPLRLSGTNASAIEFSEDGGTTIEAAIALRNNVLQFRLPSNSETAPNVKMVIKPSLGVGIGTKTPATDLHVHSASGQAAILVSGVSDSGATYSALGLDDDDQNGGTNTWYIAHKKELGTTSENDLEIGFHANYPTTTRQVINLDHSTGKVYFYHGLAAALADYAEWIEKDESEELNPGDVLGLNYTTLKVRKYIDGDEYIGIYSTAPLMAANADPSKSIDEMKETHALVALVGQVPFNKEQVDINGPIVTTKDGKRIGILLNSGKVLLKR